MIDSKAREAYMNIKAPDSLKEKVLDTQVTRRRWYDIRLSASYSVLAACFAALLLICGGAAGYFITHINGVYVNDAVVKESPVSVSMARSVSEDSCSLDIPLEVRSRSRAQVWVSQGLVAKEDEDGRLRQLDKEEQLTGRCNIHWQIDSVTTEDVMTMEVQFRNRMINYRLYFDADKKSWVLLKTDN